MAHPMQHYGERKKFPMHEGVRAPQRKIAEIVYPPGSDASYIIYECGCEGQGVGATGSISVEKCIVGHR